MLNTFSTFTGLTKQSIAGHTTVNLRKEKMMGKKEPPKITTNWHHRRAKTNGGLRDISNMVRVCRLKHRAYHALFGTKQAKDVAVELNRLAYILNETWIDPDYELVARKKER